MSTTPTPYDQHDRDEATEDEPSDGEPIGNGRAIDFSKRPQTYANILVRLAKHGAEIEILKESTHTQRNLTEQILQEITNLRHERSHQISELREEHNLRIEAMQGMLHNYITESNRSVQSFQRSVILALIGVTASVMIALVGSILSSFFFL